MARDQNLSTQNGVVSGKASDAGHYLAEQPDEVLHELLRFFEY
jgi:hypothetical protein